jgi:hypothetical protein
MGGYGSGRRVQRGPGYTTADLSSLDVRKVAKMGVLTPGFRAHREFRENGEVFGTIQAETTRHRLFLHLQGVLPTKERVDEKWSLGLSWTPCHFGGERPWFICPAPFCSRRVAILYGFPDLACRTCHSLAYRSQRETPGDRAARKANKIRKKLGWEPGFLNGTGSKPDGMHWKTFWKLYDEHNRLVRITIFALRDELRGIARRSENLG